MVAETIADFTNAPTSLQLPNCHFQEADAAALDVLQFRDAPPSGF